MTRIRTPKTIENPKVKNHFRNILAQIKDPKESDKLVILELAEALYLKECLIKDMNVNNRIKLLPFVKEQQEIVSAYLADLGLSNGYQLKQLEHSKPIALKQMEIK